MSAFKDVLRREILKVSENKFIVVTLFLLPILFSFIVWWTFSSGTLKDIPISVLDFDNSDVTRMITRSINSTQSVKVRYRVQNYSEGYDLIKSGKSYALVVFSKNFKKDLNRGKSPRIVYYYNNQTILIGSIITKDIQSAVVTMTKLIDADIRMKKGCPKDAVLSKINLIRVDERIKSNPYLNYSYFLTYAAVAHVFQVFAVLFSVWAIGIEFKEGSTKEWMKVAKNSIFTAVFAKLGLYWTVLLFQIILVYSLYVLIYGAPFYGNLFFSIISTGVYLLAYQMMGLVFVAILANLRLAMSVGAFYTSLGFSLAGMTYPNMAMPLFVRMYSSILPVRPYVNLIVDQALKGFKFQYDLVYFVWILAIALFGLSFILLLNKKVWNEDLWYQI